MGLRQSPDQIAVAALQEDVDVVGLSILSGAHVSLTRKVIERLKDQGADDIMVLVGGMIPEKDIPTLKKIGVGAVFTSGSSIPMIAAYIRSEIASDGGG